jgi:hypothetical protein
MSDTTFHGWTVETDDERNVVTMTKPSDHPSAKNGRLLVRVTGGKDTPPEITRAVAERDALAEDVRTASPDDRATWQARRDDAHQKVKELRAANRPNAESEG